MNVLKNMTLVVFCSLVLILGTSLILGKPTEKVSCDGLLCYINGVGHSCNDLTNYTCCKGPTRNKWNMKYVSRHSLNYKCCPGTGDLYNPAREVCVNGQRRLKETPTEYECGLYVTYDAKREKCCKKNGTFGKVYQKIGTCCNDTNLVDPELSCCEGRIYNRTTQTCCADNWNYHRLYDIPNGNCCLGMPYDPALQKCTPGDRVENKSEEELSKCRSLDRSRYEYYNNETQVCCSGNVYSKADVICFREMIAVPKINENDNKVCMERNPQNGQATYNTYYSGPKNRKACVGGRIILLREDEKQCLGGENYVYNTTTDLCCGGMRFISGGKAQGLKCCHNRYDAFDPSTQTCCLGEISDRTISERDGGKCCGSEAFDPRTHRCNKKEKVEKAICPDHDKLPYPQRCNNIAADFESLSEILNEGGFYVYVGVMESPIGSNSQRASTRKWKLTNVKQLVQTKSGRKKKNGKLAFSSVGTVILSARKCKCPYEMITGGRYIIFSKKPTKGGGNRRKFNLKMKNDGEGNDVIVPLGDAVKLGEWFQILLSSSDK